jgi:hypothetical protein
MECLSTDSLYHKGVTMKQRRSQQRPTGRGSAGKPGALQIVRYWRRNAPAGYTCRLCGQPATRFVLILDGGVDRLAGYVCDDCLGPDSEET